jgi:hypothetical protein
MMGRAIITIGCALVGIVAGLAARNVPGWVAWVILGLLLIWLVAWVITRAEEGAR